ncbi:MAG: hypothetical protein ACYC3Q_05780 [Gemmatimonadaceae bacterium]
MTKPLITLAGAAVLVLLAGCSDRDPRSSPTSQVEPVSRVVTPGPGAGAIVEQLPISPEEVRRHVPGSTALTIAALEDTIVAMAPDSTRAAVRHLLADTTMQMGWTPRAAEAQLLARLYRARSLERRAGRLAAERRAATIRRLAVGLFTDSLLDRSAAPGVILRQQGELGAWVALPPGATPADVAVVIAGLRSLRREAGDVVRRNERVPVTRPATAPTLRPEDEALYGRWLRRLVSAREWSDLPGYSPRRVLYVRIDP